MTLEPIMTNVSGGQSVIDTGIPAALALVERVG